MQNAILMNRRFILYIALVCLLTVAVGVGLTVFLGAEQTRERMTAAAQELAAGIEVEFWHTSRNNLQRMAKMPVVCKTAGGQLPEDNEEVLTVLETIQVASDSALVYLLNVRGIVVACTPYEEGTLTGQNYVFRPYFTSALATGMLSIYGAVGLSDEKRSVFLAAPIPDIKKGRFLGVAVIKCGLGGVDEALKKRPYPCALITDNGVVFASNRPDWMFRFAQKIDPGQRKQIVLSQQYAYEELPDLGMDLYAKTVRLDGVSYHIESESVMGGNWRLVCLAPRWYIDPALLVFVLLALGGIEASAGIALFYFRRLRNSERKLRVLFEHSSEAYMILNDGVIASCNHAAEELFGCSSDQLIGMTPLQLSPEFQPNGITSENGVKAAVDEAVAAGHATFEWVHCRFDGSIFEADVLLTALTVGESTSMFCCVRDVSEQKHAQLQLLKERKRLENVISGTNVGTWEWNIQKDEIHINKRWAMILGYTEKELLPVTSRTWRELGHPDDMRESRLALNDHFKGNRALFDVECRMRHKNGEWVWVQNCGRVISRTEDGKPLMMYGTHTDITERKRAQEKLQQALQESEMLNRLMGGREQRILEIKKEVNSLLKELGIGIKYRSAE